MQATADSSVVFDEHEAKPMGIGAEKDPFQDFPTSNYDVENWRQICTQQADSIKLFIHMSPVCSFILY